MQPCLVCETRFKPARVDTKYCSSRCRAYAWSMLNREKKNKRARLAAAKKRMQAPPKQDIVLNCLSCDKEFIQNKYHPEQKCCSNICNTRWFRAQPKNKEMILQWKRESYARHRYKNLEKSKRYKDVLRFSGNRLRALERDDYTCQNCGYEGPVETKSRSEDVVVHHIDFSGSSSRPNNKIDNLQTICRPCHIRLHTNKL